MPFIVIANFISATWPLTLIAVWVIYLIGLYLWQIIEIKRYSIDKCDQPYDSLWFEGWATSLGEKLTPSLIYAEYHQK